MFRDHYQMNTLVRQCVRHFSMSTRRPSPKYWREAATLIVAAPQEAQPTTTLPPLDPAQNQAQYDVLMLKRGSSSPFMPNSFVYPGGCVTDDDFDRKGWSELFTSITASSMDDIEASFLNIKGPRVEMMKTNKDWSESLIPDIAFRLCALRETFEESGLLFVSHETQFPKTMPRNPAKFSNRYIPALYTMPETFDVAKWRGLVSKNPLLFLKLCQEYRIVPNIWALYEWSSWLTPATQKFEEPPPKPKRFDTMFYVCCVERRPMGTEACNEEMTTAEWRTPSSWLSGHRANELKMFGPQIYESDRLTMFPTLASLARYTRLREPLGMITYLPVVALCEGEVFLILPGDEVYPECPNPVLELLEIPGTVKEFMTYKEGHNYHRAPRSEQGYMGTVHLPCGLITNPTGWVNKDHFTTDPEKVLQRALADSAKL